MYKDETGHTGNFFVTNLIVVLVYNEEIMVEEGKGKWVRIINTLYVHIWVATCLKKEARQVNQKLFEF